MSGAVLVVGGTGGFGALLVQGLVSATGFDIVIAARDLARADRLARDLGKARVRALRLDRTAVTAAALRNVGAFAVVDAAGPFQGADYRLARAAAEAGLHYVDLADARDFVAGFEQLDEIARAAGVTMVTGASSSPGLSTAVLDTLTRGWRRIDRIEIAIMPGNRVGPRGLSVFRSVLSYCGRPVRLFDGGKWVERPGWGMIARRHVAGLGRRWLSLCETPDLDIAVERYRVADSVVFRAGLELPVLHFGLLAASLPVRARLLSSLLPFAETFRRVAGWFGRFGTDRGGMLVAATGADAENVAVRARWTLVAGAGHGPLVPTLPALAVLRALAEGRARPGAHLCADIVDLADLSREFRPYQIAVRQDVERAPSPFCRVLGDAGMASLAEPVRHLHSLSRRCDVAGSADITAAPGLLPWLLCRLAGLPRPGADVPVSVSFRPDGNGGEYWHRQFAGRRYASTMHAGTGADAGLLVEAFRPFGLRFRLTPADGGLDWLLVGWRLGPVPLPRWSLPRIRCRESGDGPRFVFDIDVQFPLIGRVIHYRGWLAPVAAAEADQANAA